MEYLKNILVATALAMDAFAVSISIGTILKKVRYKEDILLSTYFSIFQFIMPIIGWYIINLIHFPIHNISQLVSSALLLILGIKMIYESIHSNKKIFNLSHKIYFILAISTSLDALIIGISFSVIHQPILFTAICAGIITFILSLIGFHLGGKIHKIVQSKSELIGGIILILIGIKILLE